VGVIAPIRNVILRFQANSTRITAAHVRLSRRACDAMKPFVAGTTEPLATGDVLNVATRLQQAAAPGEVLIGEATLELVRDMVETEPTEPFELKGKANPVPG